MPVKLSRLARARAAIIAILAKTNRPMTAGELTQHVAAGHTTADERLDILRQLERDGLVEWTTIPDPYQFPRPRPAYQLRPETDGGPPR